MINVNMEEALSKADCRFTLVVECAKRARQLVEGSMPLSECESSNPVSQAVNEVMEDKITYVRHSDGIK